MTLADAIELGFENLTPATLSSDELLGIRDLDDDSGDRLPWEGP